MIDIFQHLYGDLCVFNTAANSLAKRGHN